MARRIDDHSSPFGKGGKDSPLPMKSGTKTFTSAEGAGKMTDYPDTSEKIKSVQEAGIKKIKGHPLKPGYRN